MDNSMDMLDLSWTDKYFRTTEGGVTYEPELMDKIKVKIVYTNTNNEIFHTFDKEIDLQIKDDESILSEEDLIKIIRQHRDYESKRYKCDSIIKYFINMDPQTVIENIQDQDFNFHANECFSHFEIPKTVSFSPSLFIFHPINTIYILFREMILINPSEESPISIIKKYKNKVTKRVRISDNLPTYTSSNRKTRKR
jgi:hypothetical protein|tara:strand:- start:4693 stop:5280 length:588 start_codon:yes stop_codon:yes gene_type:complete